MKKHRTPWGYWQVLFQCPGCKVKKLVINPGHRTSLQSHEYREEVIYILSGDLFVEVGNHLLHCNFNPGDLIKISKNERHRFCNRIKTPTILIEVQFGEKLEESDIIRFADDYGRIKNGAPLRKRTSGT